MSIIKLNNAAANLPWLITGLVQSDGSLGGRTPPYGSELLNIIKALELD